MAGCCATPPPALRDRRCQPGSHGTIPAPDLRPLLAGLERPGRDRVAAAASTSARRLYRSLVSGTLLGRYDGRMVSAARQPAGHRGRPVEHLHRPLVRRRHRPPPAREPALRQRFDLRAAGQRHQHWNFSHAGLALARHGARPRCRAGARPGAARARAQRPARPGDTVPRHRARCGAPERRRARAGAQCAGRPHELPGRRLAAAPEGRPGGLHRRAAPGGRRARCRWRRRPRPSARRAGVPTGALAAGAGRSRRCRRRCATPGSAPPRHQTDQRRTAVWPLPSASTAPYSCRWTMSVPAKASRNRGSVYRCVDAAGRRCLFELPRCVALQQQLRRA